MTRVWIPAALVAMTMAVPAVAQSRAVTHVDSEKVAAALAGGRGGALVSTKDFTVSGSFRKVPGQVEVHARETDIFYVTDGEATLVLGGTVVGGKTQQLKKGDVITIPAGTPHWFKELVTPTISYLTVKVLK